MFYQQTTSSFSPHTVYSRQTLQEGVRLHSLVLHRRSSESFWTEDLSLFTQPHPGGPLHTQEPVQEAATAESEAHQQLPRKETEVCLKSEEMRAEY